MTPTREQLEQARAYLTRMALAAAFSRETADAIEVVLAATAPPTDQELQREAEAWYERQPMAATITLDAYIAGARREGRR